MSLTKALLFPGQGSQSSGMLSQLGLAQPSILENYKHEIDEFSNLIGIDFLELIENKDLEDNLNKTQYTQPSILFTSYLAYQHLLTEKDNIDYFAGHSLGEYSALAAAGYLDFKETIKLLRKRGDAMQNAVPKGVGGMVAVLGSKIEIIEKILIDNENKLEAQIANDNSEGQIVVSGKNDDLNKLMQILKENNIKNIKLPVSAPFHCKLMSTATSIMKNELENIKFQDANNILISNVTASEILDKNELKKLLIEQIESRVRWREIVVNMVNKGVNHFIEIGPGKVLSGLIKRINREVKINTINNENDIKDLKI